MSRRPILPGDIARRALLWTILCTLSAAPSLYWSQEFNRLAIGCGILLFIVLYTLATSTYHFRVFRERPFVRRTLYIGYGTRVALSIAFPLGLAVDLLPGLVSIRIVHGLYEIFLGGPAEKESFLATFLTTIVHGTFLNILITIYMAILWGLQRLFLKPPRERRGFPVLPVPPPPSGP